MNEAAIAPPGVMPSQQPMNDERSNVTQYFGRSLHTDSTTRKEMPAACPRSARRSSIVSRISLIPNRPITATRKLMPRKRSVEPKVMRSWPDTVSMPTAGEQHSERHRNDCLVLGFAAEAEADKEQKVSRYTEKNSGGPNFSANDEIIGARNVISSTATSEPMKDEVKAAVSASAALPAAPSDNRRRWSRPTKLRREC